MTQRSASLTIPLKITFSIPIETTSVDVAAEPGLQPAPLGLDPTREGWFNGNRRSPEEVLTDAVRQLDVGALDANSFHWRNALATALCSFAAYEAKTSLQAVVLAIKGKFNTFSEFEMGETQGFVASTDSVVIVSYRGTDDAGDWWTNGDFRYLDSGEYGSVHRGFYRAFHDSRNEVVRRLVEAGADQKPVVLTGHSLGGAIATIAAAEWFSTYRIRSIYTYGQPAAGFTALRSFLDVRYGDRFSRFVNEGDLVPRVPPGYRHVGKLFHFKGGGRLVHETARAAAPINDTLTMSQAEYEAHRAAMSTGAEPKPQELSTASRGDIKAEAWYPNTSDHALDRYLERILQELKAE